MVKVALSRNHPGSASSLAHRASTLLALQTKERRFSPPASTDLHRDPQVDAAYPARLIER
jgi:hypothetical protein